MLLLLIFPASIFLKELRNEIGVVLLKWLLYAGLIVLAILYGIGVFDSPSDRNNYNDEDIMTEEEWIDGMYGDEKYDGGTYNGK